MEFRSHLDGSKHLFTPEKVLEIQRNLNSDIMMVLDECVPFGADYAYTEKSLALTTRWAKRRHGCLSARFGAQSDVWHHAGRFLQRPAPSAR